MDDNKNIISMPAVPCLSVNTTEVAWLSVDGEVKIIPHQQARMMIHGSQIVVCHHVFVCNKLEIKSINALDVLELYAFVYPTRFLVPTPVGLAKSLSLDIPSNIEEEAMVIYEAIDHLLYQLCKEAENSERRSEILSIAEAMGLNGKGWGWTSYIFGTLGEAYNPKNTIIGSYALNVWRNLPEYAEQAPLPPPSNHMVTDEEAVSMLDDLLSKSKSEQRQQQMDYSKSIASAFIPNDDPENIPVTIAEAGTGVGKTLGYIAPSAVWAKKNQGAVWISTYTKNLQKQISNELDRLYPDKDIKDKKVTVRK